MEAQDAAVKPVEIDDIEAENVSEIDQEDAIAKEKVDIEHVR